MSLDRSASAAPSEPGGAATSVGWLDVVRQQLAAETQRLTNRLAPLAREDWLRPSRCVGWTVRDIIAHLEMGAEFQALAIRNGLAGNLEPLFASPAARSAVMEERRQQEPDVLFERFRTSMAALLQVFADLTPADLERTAWHQSGIHPIAWFVEQRLGEIAIHGADVDHALGGDGEIDGASADLVIESYLARLPRLFVAETAAGLSATIGLRITGPTPRSHRLRIEDGKPVIAPDATESDDPMLLADASTWLLVVTGRLAPAQAAAAGRLEATGQPVIVDRWQQLFKAL